MAFDLYVPLNKNSWGPPTDEDLTAADNPMNKWSNLPKHANFSRSDRLYGRSADFTYSNSSGKGYGNAHGSRSKAAVEDAAESFQLVDNTRAPKKFVAPAKKRAQQQSRLRQINARARGGADQQKDSNRYNQVGIRRRFCYFIDLTRLFVMTLDFILF